LIVASFPTWLADLVVVLGVAIVLPLATGGRVWWWLAAAASTTAAFLLPAGPGAALLVLPWVGLCAGTLTRAALRVGRTPGSWRLGDMAGLVAAAYAGSAAIALVASRLGASPLGVGEPILELTAVHYTYAGCAALTLASMALAGASPGRLPWARAAVVLTGVAPPIVAVGFVGRASGLLIAGAAVLALGVWTTGALQLVEAARRTLPRAARGLLAISGATIGLPMVLAIDWAAAQRWPIPALSIGAMAATHGVANAIGFALCGLGGRRAVGPSPAELDAMLARARTQAITYDRAGATLDGGGRCRQLDVGTGERVFQAAVAAVRSWAPQRAIGAVIHPCDATVEMGATVLVVLRLGPFTAVAPDRVVRVVDEPRRFAYAYGTLPGHPERGEESITIEHLDSGVVRASIRILAGPGTPLTWVGAPLVRALQRLAQDRYLRAIATVSNAVSF
jgi:uncharacterized protein (UPF0548 family)